MMSNVFDPKKDISDLFEKGQKTIDREIGDKDIEIKRQSLSEFKERVKKTIIENYSKKDIDIIDLDKGYETALSLVPNMNYSLDDVINLIEEYQNKNEFGFYSPGIYLSALINKVIQPNDVATFKITNKKFAENIGIFLPQGKLIIEGDLGGDLGYKMSGGEIILKGSCVGNVAQRMKCGKILIEKNLEDHVVDYGRVDEGVAFRMEGGELEVLGNAKIYDHGFGHGGVGYKMKGGTVIIWGDTKELGHNMEGGEIIIKGNCEPSSYGIGNWMKGGTIKIENIAYGSIGYQMERGKIILNRTEDGAYIGIEILGGYIEVEKDVYAYIGYRMINGNIKICGNLKYRSHIGDTMRGGNISVEGNVGKDAQIASGMEGGKIHIKGDVDCKVGDVMRGGIVEVDGYMPSDKSFPFKERPDRLGGTVYNKGVPIKETMRSKISRWMEKKGQ